MFFNILYETKILVSNLTIYKMSLKMSDIQVFGNFVDK
jgi:hypothetical protein